MFVQQLVQASDNKNVNLFRHYEWMHDLYFKWYLTLWGFNKDIFTL